MNCIYGDGIEVDHINGNTLDNRKSNLRLCSHKENGRNRKLNKNNTSGAKGVNWDKHALKWKCEIRINTKKLYLGLFAEIEQAKKAYAEASKKYHGEYGRIK
jgi:hypothetical protein